jgi:hypothetical protein
MGASAAAYEGTSPFIVRSSLPSSAHHAVNAVKAIMPSHDLYDSLKGFGCDWDALLVVDVEGLHRSHLSSHPIVAQTSSSDTLLSVPYATDNSPDALQSSAKAWADNCGKEQGAVEVVTVSRGEELPSSIDAFISSHPSHIVIIAGHNYAQPNFSRRQLVAPSAESMEESVEELLYGDEYDDEVEDILEEILEEEEDYYPSSNPLKGTQEGAQDPAIYDNADGYYELLASTNSSSNTTGLLLERAQIFTTPIITALLVTFGIFLPILGLGVSALAGIQVPPQMMSIAKTMSVSQTKKDQ